MTRDSTPMVPVGVSLSIIIVSHNTRSVLERCLSTAIGSRLAPGWEVIVVDNGSSDGSAEMVRSAYPTATVIENSRNLGFARANNQGMALAAGRYVLLLNSDALAPPLSLDALIDFMERHPDAGACGPRLERPDGTPQEFGFGDDPSLGYLLRRGLVRLVCRRALHEWGAGRTGPMDWVSGACLMVRHEVIDQVGTLDEKFFMYFEDNDWCMRIRQAGWKVYYYSEVSVTHLGGRSRSDTSPVQEAYYRSLRYLYAKHFSRLSQATLCIALIPYRWLVGR